MSSSDEYLPSDNVASEDSGYSSRDSTSSESEGLRPSPGELSERVFETNCYPPDRKITSYSKTELLLDVLSILDGTPELETLISSPLGSLLSLPARQSALSGKIVHNFLCRQIYSEDPDELWFVFGGKPLRFSLHEFAAVTHLPCGPYPDPDELKRVQEWGETNSPYWYNLIGPSRSTTVAEIVAMLKADKTLPPWRKFQLALVVIVEGVLLCTTQPTKPYEMVVEMVKHTEFFLHSYPWGRRSFELTIEMVKLGMKVSERTELISKLKKDSLVLHGFPVAIQLFILESVPLLKSLIPNPHDTRSFLSRRHFKLSNLRCFTTDNITSAEYDPQLEVINICTLTAVAVNDRRIRTMLSFIEKGYGFSISDWSGGDNSLPRKCVCSADRGDIDCGCGFDKVSSKNASTSAKVRQENRTGGPSCTKCDHFEKQMRTLKRKVQRDIVDLRVSILEEVRMMLSSDVTAEGKKTVGGGTSSDKRPEKQTGPPGELHEQETGHFNDTLRTPVYGSVAHGAPDELVDDIQPLKSGITSPERHVTQSPLKGKSAEADAECENGHHNARIRLSRCSKRKAPPESSPAVIVCGLTASNGVSGAEAPSLPNSLVTHDTYIVDLETEDTVPSIMILAFQRHQKSGDASGTALQSCKGEMPRVSQVVGAAPFLHYSPLPQLTDADAVSFQEKLASYSKGSYVLDGVELSNRFLTELMRPHQCVMNSHVDFMIRPLWKRCGNYMLSKRYGLLDSLFGQLLEKCYTQFKEADHKTAFGWHKGLRNVVNGDVGDRHEVMKWFRDVDVLYAPVNWGKRHWVALVIRLAARHIEVLDPNVTVTRARKVARYMQPFTEMIPYLIRSELPRDILKDGVVYYLESFTFSRSNVKCQSEEQAGDCGPLAVKLIELHAMGFPLSLVDALTDQQIRMLRLHYAMQVFEDFVGSSPSS